MSQTETIGSATSVEAAAIHDLILVLADSKRLLGMRYAEWILGAPELETGIACASMAQDEWGHGRLLYALLKEIVDVDRLEHGREAEEYRNMEALDRAPEDWFELVAINALVDQALTVQLEALVDSSYAPLKQRVAKLIDEERFHTAHGAAWLKRLAAIGGEPTARAQRAAAGTLTLAARWFGPDSATANLLVNSGVAAEAGSSLRGRFLERVHPLVQLLGIDAGNFAEPDFTNFDESKRRGRGSAPDSATVTRIRGDKNRAFRMD